MLKVIKKTNGACVLVSLDKKILLIKRSETDKSMPGVWEFPSGTKEKNESIIECVVRETKEETGIEIKAENLIAGDVEHYSFVNREGIKKEVDEHTYICHLKEKLLVHLTSEHSNYAWVGLDNLDDYFSDKNDLIYLRINRIVKRGGLLL